MRIGAGRGDLPYLPVLVPPCPSPLVSLCLPAHRLPSHHLYAPQPPPWGGGCRPAAACGKRNAVGPGRGGWSQSPPGGGGGRPAAGRWGQEPGDTRRDFVAATPGGHGAERQPRPRHLRAAPGAPRPPPGLRGLRGARGGPGRTGCRGFRAAAGMSEWEINPRLRAQPLGVGGSPPPEKEVRGRQRGVIPSCICLSIISSAQRGTRCVETKSEPSPEIVLGQAPGAAHRHRHRGSCACGEAAEQVGRSQRLSGNGSKSPLRCSSGSLRCPGQQFRHRGIAQHEAAR